MFLTSGGSAALGAILKGVFGAINKTRQNKFELELARECRGNEFALKFQQQINREKVGFSQGSRGGFACIILGTLSAVVILCTLFPSAEIITIANAAGEGQREILLDSSLSCKADHCGNHQWCTSILFCGCACTNGHWFLLHTIWQKDD